jgi:hypothetical protein
MSYRTRQVKRRKKAAIHAARKKKRNDRPGSNPGYYLTTVRYDCRCQACGAKLRKRADMVYRQLGPVTLCVPCADRDSLVDYRPSLRWERARRPSKAA